METENKIIIKNNGLSAKFIQKNKNSKKTIKTKTLKTIFSTPA